MAEWSVGQPVKQVLGAILQFSQHVTEVAAVPVIQPGAGCGVLLEQNLTDARFVGAFKGRNLGTC